LARKVVDYRGMKNLTPAVLALAAALCPANVSAQSTSDTRTVLLARGGVRAGNFTYHYLEVFITATLKAGSLGNFEFWLQRLPGNHAQVQFRYARTFN
jgi:hypothetical protein